MPRAARSAYRTDGGRSPRDARGGPHQLMAVAVLHEAICRARRARHPLDRDLIIYTRTITYPTIAHIRSAPPPRHPGVMRGRGVEDTLA